VEGHKIEKMMHVVVQGIYSSAWLITDY